MVSTVKPRPNHYEMLGLKPTATPDEIKQAFNRELLRPRPFGGLAQLGVAFETLKDPAKRKAYDASIGLSPPEPSKAPSALQSRLQYIIAPAGTERPAFNMAATRPLHAAAPPAAKPVPVAEPRAPSFIAAPVVKEAKPEVQGEPAPFVNPRPETPEPRVELKPAPEAHFVDDAEHNSMMSRQVGIAVGGVLLAAVFVGAWAGTSVQNPEAPDKPAQAATLSLPPPKPLPGVLDREPAAAPIIEAKSDVPASRPAAATETVKRAMPRPIQLTAEEEQQLAGGQFVESATAQIAAAGDTPAETATEAPASVAAAASMPLPNRVIARTIHRIGYSCGQVASTTALDSPGAFKVTCTSGQSYQATPVRGRYHFRRMSSQ